MALASAALLACACACACSCSAGDLGSSNAPAATSESRLGGVPASAGSVVGLAGKCLDVNGASTADGAIVQLYACNGTSAQQWSLVNHQLVGPGGKCLDVVDKQSADGAKVQLWSCSGASNQQWSVQGGQIVGLGGRCLDVTGNVSADRTRIQIWSCSGGANQRFAFTAPLPQFYGGNAHWDYSWTAQQIADRMHQVGMTVVRMDTGGYDASKYGRVGDYAAKLAAIDPKLRVFAAITGDFDESKDEATNYTTTFAGAKAVATALGAAGITDFECGNERPSDPRVFPDQTLAGDLRSQYAGGAPWRALRGAIRGMIDGVKSANPSYRAVVNFTIAQVAASDMLWDGVEPDGSAGHPAVRWDVTSWHNYRVYGSPFDMGTNGHGKNFNLIDYVSKAYGKPIMITEWNANPEDSDVTKTSFSADWLQTTYSNRALYQIESVMIYQLDGGPQDFGLFAFPGQTEALGTFARTHLAL
jgi:hypothetical protein